METTVPRRLKQQKLDLHGDSLKAKAFNDIMKHFMNQQIKEFERRIMKGVLSGEIK